MLILITPEFSNLGSSSFLFQYLQLEFRWSLSVLGVHLLEWPLVSTSPLDYLLSEAEVTSILDRFYSYLSIVWQRITEHRHELCLESLFQCIFQPHGSCRRHREQESTGARHWLGLALVVPNDDNFGTPRNGLGICGHQIPHALSQTRLPTARFFDGSSKRVFFDDPVRKN